MAIKAKTAEMSRTAAMLLLHVPYIKKKSCIVLKDLLPHTISGL
jgi:hypothetical protein